MNNLVILKVLVEPSIFLHIIVWYIAISIIRSYSYIVMILFCNGIMESLNNGNLRYNIILLVSSYKLRGAYSKR